MLFMKINSLLYIQILLLSTISLFADEPSFKHYDGVGVVLDLNSSSKTVFGTRADERLNPCSTFKILNSMIALDTKVLKDENEVIKWDGTVRQYGVWNKDHTMKSAIAVSTVWFYQEIARRVGVKRMQEYLYKVPYGNSDTSGELTNFWLGDGSLKISVNEQIKFLSALVKDELSFSKRAMSTTKDIITLEKKDSYKFAGKTGSCGGIGWFVGFVEENNSSKVFAFNIKGKGASGPEAKKIVIEYFKNK